MRLKKDTYIPTKADILDVILLGKPKVEVGQYMIKAVNSHRRLLRALKIATKYINVNISDTELKEIEKAIAQAEGGKQL